ncbi:MAG: hypothetical protein AOA66_1243 [Candidatus Bathyarchaeota archaeon BA2]|nr:MAG: hypothetical protein AOA66_1243 [Candidatus Bathyarchaeota archaeon BA2]
MVESFLYSEIYQYTISKILPKLRTYVESVKINNNRLQLPILRYLFLVHKG